MQVKPKRQQSLSIRWIIGAVRAKAGRPMFLRLADELMAAYRREGEAMTKREKHDQDGRRQQGVHPLRLVSRVSRSAIRGTEVSRVRDAARRGFLAPLASDLCPSYSVSSVPLWLI